MPLPDPLTRWTVDRYYTELVQGRVAAGEAPSVASEGAHEQLVAETTAAHPDKKTPGYVEGLGREDEEDSIT